MGLKESRLSDHQDYWHAALVLRHGKVIAIGTNKGWRHAEEVAITRVPEALLRGSEIVSLRFNKSGKLRMAKPCNKCLSLMLHKGLKRVRYSDRQGEIRQCDVQDAEVR